MQVRTDCAPVGTDAADTLTGETFWPIFTVTLDRWL